MSREKSKKGEVTKEWLRKHYFYRDGSLFVKIPPAHSRHNPGDEVGYLHTSGRRRVTLFGRKHGLHQLVWIYFYGLLPSYGIDHRDRNPLNNRIENLRPCTAKTNAQNIDWGPERGITLTDSGKWLAAIGVDNGKKYLGTYADKSDAIAARVAAEMELFEYTPLKD